MNSPKNMTSRSKNNLDQSPQLSNRQTDVDKPMTPYDERVIPAIRNQNNRSRMEKNDQPAPVTNNNPKNNIAEEDQQDNQTNDSDGVVPDNNNNNDANNINEFTEQDDPNGMDGTEEMSEKEVREAALMNDILGKQIVRLFELDLILRSLVLI